MDAVIERAVERAIVTMRDNLGEQLTVDDLARAAMFSKFHFTRIFQRVTGVSPGRFLSAMRLQRAKQLLVSTSLNVADISIQVGYNSVGTFSTRFTRSVGLSPTAYRRLDGFAGQIPVDPSREDAQVPQAVVRGCVWTSTSEPGSMVFVGLFPNRIPEGRPVCCDILSRPGPYQFDAVPPGDWYLLAQSITASGPEDLTRGVLDANQALSVGTHGPISIRRDSPPKVIDLRLQPIRSVHPPVLLALLDARKLALRVSARRELASVAQLDPAIYRLRPVPEPGRNAA